MSETMRERLTKADEELSHRLSFSGNEQAAWTLFGKAVRDDLRALLSPPPGTPSPVQREPDAVVTALAADEAKAGRVETGTLYPRGSGGYQQWLHDTESGRRRFVSVYFGSAPVSAPSEPHGCSIVTYWCTVHDRHFTECDPSVSAPSGTPEHGGPPMTMGEVVASETPEAGEALWKAKYTVMRAELFSVLRKLRLVERDALDADLCDAAESFALASTPSEGERESAWEDVWELCRSLGMTMQVGKTGREHVLDFIRGLAAGTQGTGEGERLASAGGEAFTTTPVSAPSSEAEEESAKSTAAAHARFLRQQADGVVASGMRYDVAAQYRAVADELERLSAEREAGRTAAELLALRLEDGEHEIERLRAESKELREAIGVIALLSEPAPVSPEGERALREALSEMVRVYAGQVQNDGEYGAVDRARTALAATQGDDRREGSDG